MDLIEEKEVDAFADKNKVSDYATKAVEYMKSAIVKTYGKKGEKGQKCVAKQRRPVSANPASSADRGVIARPSCM